MKLTEEEINKIDEALAALKLSLKEELLKYPEKARAGVNMDEPFLKKISETYLSGSGVGIIGLLLDSGLFNPKLMCANSMGCFPSQSCLCGVTCAAPSEGICTHNK